MRAVLLILLLLSFPPGPGGSIADGDTIPVLAKNRQFPTRLYGIDAPEKAPGIRQQGRACIREDGDGGATISPRQRGGYFAGRAESESGDGSGFG